MSNHNNNGVKNREGPKHGKILGIHRMGEFEFNLSEGLRSKAPD